MIDRININGVTYSATALEAGAQATGITITVDGVTYLLGDVIAPMTEQVASTEVSGNIDKISINGVVYDIRDVEDVAAERKRAMEAEKALRYNAMQYDTLGVSVYADKAEIYGRSIYGTPRTMDFPAATTERAGVMSANDKVKLNASIKNVEVSPNVGDVELDLEDNTGNINHVVFPEATLEKAGVMSADDKSNLDLVRDKVYKEHIEICGNGELKLNTLTRIDFEQHFLPGEYQMQVQMTGEIKGYYLVIFSESKGNLGNFLVTTGNFTEPQTLVITEEDVILISFRVNAPNIVSEGEISCIIWQEGYDITNDIDKIKNDVDQIQHGVLGVETAGFFKTNLFNENDADIEKGFFLDYSGTSVASNSYMITGYIPFTKYMGRLTPTVAGERIDKASAFLALYDEHKRKITQYREDRVGGMAVWEDGVAYVRFSIPNYTKGNIQITIGEEIYPYIKYGEYSLLDQYSTLQQKSIVGKDSVVKKIESLDADTFFVVNEYPYYIKKGTCISFAAEFDSFTGMKIGEGYQSFLSKWLEIDNTNILLKSFGSSENIAARTEHGLDIKSYIKLSIYINNGQWDVALHTLGGLYTYTFDISSYEAQGELFVQAGSPMRNVIITGGNSDYRLPVWAFGDSYFGVADDRWIGVMKNIGFFNFLINGMSGITSPYMYEELIRCLNYGTPRYLLWCLGMNDSDIGQYTKYFNNVKSLCKSAGIELIAATIPSVPTRDKSAINEIVVNSGLRYIDFAKAVGADVESNWYEGFLHSDGVHPTELGAQALAMQVLIDFPEIMQY